MFKLKNFIFLKQIITHFECDGCNRFQKSWDGGNKRAKKCSECSKTPDWNIPQVIRSIGNKCVMKPGF